MLTLLAILAACGDSGQPATGAEPSATPASAEAPRAPAGSRPAPDPPRPGVTAPDVSRPAGVETTFASGLVARAEFADEALEGFPVVLNLEVRNPTDQLLKSPDFGTRPHLVHFKLVSPSGAVTERFNTPPSFDTGGDWSIPAGSRRSVRLEIPSSAGFAGGTWSVTVLAGEREDIATFPAKTVRLAPPRPVGGTAYYDKLVANASGAVFPWLHRAAEGFDLYLDQLTPGPTGKLLARYHAVHLGAQVEPVLSRGAATSARSRHLYWRSGPAQVTVAKVDGLASVATPAAIDMPWPSVVPLARGISTGRQALAVPLWIPGPKGGPGEVKFLWVDDRGAVSFRGAADLPRAPSVAETSIDAGGNPLLALAHDAGIDIYRLDGSIPAHLPAAGTRAWKADGGWSTVALAFDAHPERGSHAGGQLVLALQLATTTDAATGKPTTISRTVRADIAGNLVDTGAASAWSGPTTVTALLPSGYEPYRYLAVAPDGSTWFGVEGRAPRWVAASGAGELWPGESPETGLLRRVAGERVLADVKLALEPSK